MYDSIAVTAGRRNIKNYLELKYVFCLFKKGRANSEILQFSKLHFFPILGYSLSQRPMCTVRFF